MRLAACNALFLGASSQVPVLSQLRALLDQIITASAGLSFTSQPTYISKVNYDECIACTPQWAMAIWALHVSRQPSVRTI